MKWFFVTTCITLCLFCVFGCTKKELPVAKKEDSVLITAPVSSVAELKAEATKADETAHVKLLAQNLKFIASLENEILKLLIPGSVPRTNQFDVLASGFEKLAGAKVGFLVGFDCQKISVKASRKHFDIFSECIRPPKKLAEMTEESAYKYSVLFLSQHWPTIVGSSATLNPTDRICNITLKANKVQILECKNSVFSLQATQKDISLLELRITRYLFNRDQKEEVIVEGGQYKDLIEVKKVNLKIPMTGKISVIEKELKVKDDFVDMQNKLLGREEVKPVPVKETPKEVNKNEKTPNEENQNANSSDQTQAPPQIPEQQSQTQSQNGTQSGSEQPQQEQVGNPQSVPPPEQQAIPVDENGNVVEGAPTFVPGSGPAPVEDQPGEQQPSAPPTAPATTLPQPGGGNGR